MHKILYPGMHQYTYKTCPGYAAGDTYCTCMEINGVIECNRNMFYQATQKRYWATYYMLFEIPTNNGFIVLFQNKDQGNYRIEFNQYSYKDLTEEDLKEDPEPSNWLNAQASDVITKEDLLLLKNKIESIL